MPQTIFEVDTNTIKNILMKRMGYKDFSNPFISRISIKRIGHEEGSVKFPCGKNLSQIQDGH